MASSHQGQTSKEEDGISLCHPVLRGMVSSQFTSIQPSVYFPFPALFSLAPSVMGKTPNQYLPQLSQPIHYGSPLYMSQCRNGSLVGATSSLRGFGHLELYRAGLCWLTLPHLNPSGMPWPLLGGCKGSKKVKRG